MNSGNAFNKEKIKAKFGLEKIKNNFILKKYLVMQKSLNIWIL